MIPEPKYYTIERLANRWKMSLQDVLNYGMDGEIKIRWYFNDTAELVSTLPPLENDKSIIDV